ncbi:hypothetical protein JD844_009332 [Phrynosoma platyrhinos]|uniref:Tetratricopeptide repeat protein 39B n=1 Tax=Phrynosoma platyrhinos TaxID=52577 RepID=A0ABQ7TF21_PHRPL|nr:hypothetical protein JD844_009332 [Phrynosoma platyrhinos]
MYGVAFDWLGGARGIGGREGRRATKMDLKCALEECSMALNLFLNNKFSEALELLRPWSKGSMYHALGYSTILVMQAAMTFEQQDIQMGIATMKEALQTCQKFRKRNTVVESLSSLVSKQSVDQLSEEEMHAEICYAECLLQKAALTFVQVDRQEKGMDKNREDNATEKEKKGKEMENKTSTSPQKGEKPAKEKGTNKKTSQMVTNPQASEDVRTKNLKKIFIISSESEMEDMNPLASQRAAARKQKMPSNSTSQDSELKRKEKDQATSKVLEKLLILPVLPLKLQMASCSCHLEEHDSIRRGWGCFCVEHLLLFMRS